MAGDFGSDYITISDEEGNEFELEHLETLEIGGEVYMAFLPANEPKEGGEDEDYGIIILKSIQEDGEEMLSTLDDEEELEQVYEAFMTLLTEDEETPDPLP